MSGAALTFYAVGTTGYGSNASSLGIAATASDGTYTLSYTCPSNEIETYIVAVGGNAGKGINPAIGLMAPIGPCGDIESSTSVVINELTTAAAEAALAQFIDSSGQMIGASSTNSGGLGLGYLNYYNLAQVASGGDSSVSGGSSNFLPTSEQCVSESPPPNCDGLERLNTLADIIAACVSSTGPDSSPCGALFTSTSIPTSATTLAAIHAVALNPTLNVDAIFAVQSMISLRPFDPALAVAPDGFEIGLMLTVGNDLNRANNALAIDSAGNPFVVSFDSETLASAVNELVAANGYTATSSFDPGIAVDDGPSLAIDTNSNLFLTNRDSNSLSELTAVNTYSAATIITPGGEAVFDHPQSIALDAAGDAFVANNGETGGSVSELVASGSYSTGFLFASADASLTCPFALVLDLVPNIFVANCDSTVSELTAATGYRSGSSFDLTTPNDQTVASSESSIELDANSNVFVLTSGLFSGGISELTAASTYRSGEFLSPIGAAFDEPTAMALDSAGDVFVSNFTSTISEVTAASEYTDGSFVSPGGANICGADALAIDAAGNIFIANACSNFAGSAPAVSELVGLAAPVLTPAQACLPAVGKPQHMCAINPL